MQHDKNPRILNLIAGMVFLGVPHWVDRDEENYWIRITWILKCSSQINMSKMPTSQLADTKSILVDVAHRFDDIEIRAGVLNVCEKRTTKVKSSRLLGILKNVVVSVFLQNAFGAMTYHYRLFPRILAQLKRQKRVALSIRSVMSRCTKWVTTNQKEVGGSVNGFLES